MLDLGFLVGLEEDIVDFVYMFLMLFEIGDMVIFFIDGIIEVENLKGNFYGLNWLIDSVKNYSYLLLVWMVEVMIVDLKNYIGD